MIRATLDVNVLVSAFATSSGAPAELIAWWFRRHFTVVLSEHILAGVARVWARPYWQSRYPAAEAERALALMRARATLVVPVPTVPGIAADEEDDLVLATAVAGNAEYLVTSDGFLQGLGQFQGITILSPRQFLEMLVRESPRAR